MKTIPSFRLLDIQVNAMTLGDLKAVATETIENSRRALIANHNLHSVYLYHRDARMPEFYGRARYSQIDGMPLVLLGKLFGYPVGAEHRLGAVDWVPELTAEAARRGWRVFHLGSKPGVAERGARILRERFPGLQIATAHGYFDPDSDENRRVVERINAYRPHVLVVGMGMPRQEHWILDNMDRVEANVILHVGAYMDFVAGMVPTPPRWMGPLFLEWLYRLYNEPRRLWKRYLLEPWFVLWLALREGVRRGIAAAGQGRGRPV